MEIKTALMGLKRSSDIKSPGCSFRGHGLDSQHPRWLTIVYNYSSR